MPISFTGASGIASTSRYIEVYRGSVYVSRHSDQFEAVEAAYNHAEEHGEGTYELRFPNKMLVIEKSGFIGIPPPTAPALTLATVNGGSPVHNNQQTVNLVGSGFGTTQGTVTYDGNPLTVLDWQDTVVQVAWADVPFDSFYGNYDLDGSSRVLVVNNGSSSDSESVVTVPSPNAYYGLITSIPTGSIYENDTDIVPGLDKGYIRILSGTVDSVNVATGILQGISPGAVIEYAVWDASWMAWFN